MDMDIGCHDMNFLDLRYESTICLGHGQLVRQSNVKMDFYTSSV